MAKQLQGRIPLDTASGSVPVVLVDTSGNPLTAQPISGTVTADTELPAAAALSDTTANPTAPMVGAGQMLWDSSGTQWVRAKQKANGWPGFALVRSSDGSEYGALTSFPDGQPGGGYRLLVQAEGRLYNGASTDLYRNTVEATFLPSAARTTTQTSADITTFNARNLQVVLDMTVVGTGSVTVTINGKDSASGKYFLLLTGAAIATNSTNRYKVGPDVPAVANVAAQDYLPRFIQIIVTANNANSATYSVGYVLGV